MAALDQRPPMFEAIAQARKITSDQVTYADVAAAKRLLVEALASHCSSSCSIRIAVRPRRSDAGTLRLIMTLEEHRVEETSGGRKSRVIENWSVAKIRAMGGDAVNLWPGMDADAAIKAHQQLVRQMATRSAQ